MLSLAGVALGASGSLFGQYLVSRASTRQVEVQEAAAHRAELKGAVLKFLSVAARVEKVAFTREDGAAGDEAAGTEDRDNRAGAALGRLDELVDAVWLAQAEIDLAARSEPLRGATYRYAFRLAETARGETTDASELRGPQVEFMDAAYGDMWPGLRRTDGRPVTPR
ncbi:hypothetical protein HUT18_23040 [Streptomyces sp. NA04227]|nr:hypothetical protein HUT18_23040 [Streptomyces sp. NA04227]